MIHQTNIRIIDKFGDIAGEWYVQGYENKARLDLIDRELAELKILEPHREHRLETRGTLVSWHPYSK